MKTKGFGILLIVLVIGIFVLAIGGGYYLNNNLKSLDIKNLGSNTSTEETMSWKDYINTKYVYTFKYPSAYEIYSTEGDQNLLKITPTATGITVVPKDDQQKRIFSVQFAGTEFTEEAIKSRFGPLATVKVENIEHNGVLAYKATLESQYTTTGVLQNGPFEFVTYYFKTPNEEVLELTVSNQDTALKIFNTFQPSK